MPDGIMATFLYAFDWHPVKEQENKDFVTKFQNAPAMSPSLVILSATSRPT